MKKIFIIFLSILYLLNIVSALDIDKLKMSYWFDSPGDYTDKSGNNLTLSVVGNPLFLNQSKIKGGLILDDNTYFYLNHSSLTTFGKGITISFWINSIDEYTGYFEKSQNSDNEIRFFSDNSGFPYTYFVVKKGGLYCLVYSLDNRVFSNGWQMLSVVYDYNNCGNSKIYLNTTDITTSASGNYYVSTENTGNIYLFNNVRGGGYKLDGAVDNFQVFNATLSQTDINYLYNNGLGRQLPIPTKSLYITTNLQNNSIHYYNPMNISFFGEVEYTSEIFNCSLYIDNQIEYSFFNINILQSQNYLKDFGEYEDYNYHTITLYCDNNEVNSTLVYNYIIDTIQPRIIPDFQNNTIYNKKFNQTFSQSIYFENLNLIDVIGRVYNSTNDTIKDSINLNVSSMFGEPLTNLTITFLYDLNNFVSGVYYVSMYAKDYVLEREKIYTFYVEDCQENWKPYYTLCNPNDEQMLYYLDENECDTYNNLPADNGTIQSCNYCTISYVEKIEDCMKMFLITNYNTCCAVTNKTEDCEVPESEKLVNCVGEHKSSDIYSVIIDFFVEYGISLITYVEVIALVVLGVWAFKLLKG